MNVKNTALFKIEGSTVKQITLGTDGEPVEAVEDAKVQSMGFVGGTNRTKMRFMFVDNCIEGEIHLNFDNPQKTQMHWKYYTMQSWITDTSGCAPYNEMPRGEMTLIKQ